MRKKHLFGTRGVRGPIATKVTPELMLKLGQALASYMGEGKIVVGRDARTSGQMLQHAFVAGILAGGCNIVDIGMVPSPCVAFTTRDLGAKAGAIITASHNPPPDNGVAFYRSDGMEFLPEEELAVEGIMFGERTKLASWEVLGNIQRYDAIPRYVQAVKQAVNVKPGIKVVIDCANGVGATTTPYLLRELGCKVVTLNSHLDGHFPGHPAEPQPWNLGDLMCAVREIGADVGFAHDGDADRLAVIDEGGRFIKHDSLIALFAKHILEARSGGVAITSINTSVAIEEVVARAGGRTIRTALGNIHAAMCEHKAVFAGEPGKIIFSNFGPWIDGVLAAAKLLELMSLERKPLSKIFAEEVPDYPMYFEDFLCPDERKVEFMRNIHDYLLANVCEIRNLIEVDGLRVNRKNGSWVLIRVSGTEPKARLVVEGRTKAEMEKLKKIGIHGIREFLNQ